MFKEIIINEDSTVEVIEATESEIAEIMSARQEAELLQTAIEKKLAEASAKRQALLNKLGITEDEAKLLLS